MGIAEAQRTSAGSCAVIVATDPPSVAAISGSGKSIAEPPSTAAISATAVAATDNDGRECNSVISIDIDIDKTFIVGV
jgi:hypothetical protein